MAFITHLPTSVRFTLYPPIPRPLLFSYLRLSLSKFDFVLPRHQGLDVRSLLEQDLLLLHSLCLSPEAATAAVSDEIASENPPTAAPGGGVSAEENGTAAVVVANWRLYVELLVLILRRVPAAADDSLAVVEHIALPCLSALAGLCLDGVTYPTLRDEVVTADTSLIVSGRGDNSSIDAGAAAASERPPRTGQTLDDTVLSEVLRVSAESWSTPPSSAGGGGSGVVEWTTPLQTKNLQLARCAWQGLATAVVSGGDRFGSGSAPASSPPAQLGEWEHTEEPVARPRPRLPEHWLLRLMTSRQSPVLRKFAGRVLASLAASKGMECREEVAEVAAHLLGLVGAEGSEAAALQVSWRERGEGVCVLIEGAGAMAVAVDTLRE